MATFDAAIFDGETFDVSATVVLATPTSRRAAGMELLRRAVGLSPNRRAAPNLQARRTIR